MSNDNGDRYMAAMHAMQSGVAAKMNYDGGPESGETSPKQLRVGVNSALISNGALLQLLVDKGLITSEEYAAVLTDYTERDVKSYEDWLNKRFDGGPSFHLG